MTTKRIKFYVEGWTCFSCNHENVLDADNCAKCSKPFDDTKDQYFDDDKCFELPAKWVICYDCAGEGTTYLGWAAKDQPAFTMEDFYEEGPDFYEDYMSGHYDAQCPECHGAGKVKEIDEKAIRNNPELSAILDMYYEDLEAEAAMNAEYEAERRMGA